MQQGQEHRIHGSENPGIIEGCETGSDMTLIEINSKGRGAMAALFASIFLLGGCSMEDSKSKVSDDAKALKDLIEIPATLKSAKWEMFGTPEYKGGVPGRTDYMTLIAEIVPLENVEKFTSGANDKSVYIVPEAARPWISDQFRTILEKNKNSSFDLTTARGCQIYDTKVKKSGRVINGFSCEKSGHVLLYLSIF